MNFDSFSSNADCIVYSTDYELDVLKEKHPYLGWSSIKSKVVTYAIGVNNIPMYMKITAVKLQGKNLLFYRPYGRLTDLDELERHIEAKTDAKRRGIPVARTASFDFIIQKLRLK